MSKSSSSGSGVDSGKRGTKRSPLVLTLDSDGDDDSFSSSSSPIAPPAAAKAANAKVASKPPVKKPAEHELPSKNPPNATAPTTTTTTTTATTAKQQESFDIVLPASIGTKSGDCTVLVQIEPKDAQLLELEGANGAIGRLEADDQELTLDLKGYQFAGHIFPGPSVMVVTLNKAGMLKVDGITDEFVHMVQKRKRGLDAVVTGDTDGRYHNIGRDELDGDDDDVRNATSDDEAAEEDYKDQKQKPGKPKVPVAKSQNKKAGGTKSSSNSARKRKRPKPSASKAKR